MPQMAYSAQLTNKVGGAIAVGAKIGVDHVLALLVYDKYGVARYPKP